MKKEKYIFFTVFSVLLLCMMPVAQAEAYKEITQEVILEESGTSEQIDIVEGNETNYDITWEPFLDHSDIEGSVSNALYPPSPANFSVDSGNIQAAVQTIQFDHSDVMEGSSIQWWRSPFNRKSEDVSINLELYRIDSVKQADLQIEQEGAVHSLQEQDVDWHEFELDWVANEDKIWEKSYNGSSYDARHRFHHIEWRDINYNFSYVRTNAPVYSGESYLAIWQWQQEVEQEQIFFTQSDAGIEGWYNSTTFIDGQKEEWSSNILTDVLHQYGQSDGLSGEMMTTKDVGGEPLEPCDLTPLDTTQMMTHTVDLTATVKHTLGRDMEVIFRGYKNGSNVFSSFFSDVESGERITTTWTVEEKGFYDWEVEAIDDDGDSATSERITFEVVEDYEGPQLLGETIESEGNYWIVDSWAEPLRAEEGDDIDFKFTISTEPDGTGPGSGNLYLEVDGSQEDERSFWQSDGKVITYTLTYENADEGVYSIGENNDIEAWADEVDYYIEEDDLVVVDDFDNYLDIVHYEFIHPNTVDGYSPDDRIGLEQTMLIEADVENTHSQHSLPATLIFEEDGTVYDTDESMIPSFSTETMVLEWYTDKEVFDPDTYLITNPQDPNHDLAMYLEQTGDYMHHEVELDPFWIDERYPADGEDEQPLDTTLESVINIETGDFDETEMRFRDEGGSTIALMTVEDGEIASYTWENLEINETYEWFIHIYKGEYDNYFMSELWEFETTWLPVAYFDEDESKTITQGETVSLSYDVIKGQYDLISWEEIYWEKPDGTIVWDWQAHSNFTIHTEPWMLGEHTYKIRAVDEHENRGPEDEMIIDVKEGWVPDVSFVTEPEYEDPYPVFSPGDVEVEFEVEQEGLYDFDKSNVRFFDPQVEEWVMEENRSGVKEDSDTFDCTDSTDTVHTYTYKVVYYDEEGHHGPEEELRWNIVADPLPPTDPDPPDDSTDIDHTEDLDLEVQVHNQGDREMKAHFYKSTGAHIGTETGLYDGDYASATWPADELDPDETYGWYVLVVDEEDEEREIESDTWFFTTGELEPPIVEFDEGEIDQDIKSGDEVVLLYDWWDGSYEVEEAEFQWILPDNTIKPGWDWYTVDIGYYPAIYPDMEGEHELKVRGIDEEENIGPTDYITVEVHPPPEVETLEPEKKEYPEVELKLELDMSEYYEDDIVVSIGFEYWEQGDFENREEDFFDVVQNSGTYSETYDFIEADQIYEYRAVIEYTIDYEERDYGEDEYFQWYVPEFEYSETTAIGFDYATLWGDIIHMGDADSVVVGFQYRPSDSTTWSLSPYQQKSYPVDFSSDVDELQPNTEYEVRVTLYWAEESYYSDINTFNTDEMFGEVIAEWKSELDDDVFFNSREGVKQMEIEIIDDDYTIEMTDDEGNAEEETVESLDRALPLGIFAGEGDFRLEDDHTKITDYSLQDSDGNIMSEDVHYTIYTGDGFIVPHSLDIGEEYTFTYVPTDSNAFSFSLPVHAFPEEGEEDAELDLGLMFEFYHEDYDNFVANYSYYARDLKEFAFVSEYAFDLLLQGDEFDRARIKVFIEEDQQVGLWMEDRKDMEEVEVHSKSTVRSDIDENHLGISHYVPFHTLQSHDFRIENVRPPEIAIDFFLPPEQYELRSEEQKTVVEIFIEGVQIAAGYVRKGGEWIMNQLRDAGEHLLTETPVGTMVTFLDETVGDAVRWVGGMIVETINFLVDNAEWMIYSYLRFGTMMMSLGLFFGTVWLGAKFANYWYLLGAESMTKANNYIRSEGRSILNLIILAAIIIWNTIQIIAGPLL